MCCDGANQKTATALLPTVLRPDVLWWRQVIVRTPVGALQIITPLIARHNVYNILAAVAVGLAVTVDGEPIPLKVLTLNSFSSVVHSSYSLT